MAKPEGFQLHKPSEEELVRAVLAGDNTAYGMLYDRLAPLVRAVCHDYTHNLTEAQDLTQDVFLRAYQKMSELHKPESFGPWIIGIARRRCSEWCRKKTREQRRLAARRARPPLVADAGRPDEDGQLLRLVAMLDDDERLAVHAFYLQDKSAEEARRIMGRSRSGFYKLLDRARMKLRRQLEQDEEKIQ